MFGGWGFPNLVLRIQGSGTAELAGAPPATRPAAPALQGMVYDVCGAHVLFGARTLGYGEWDGKIWTQRARRCIHQSSANAMVYVAHATACSRGDWAGRYYSAPGAGTGPMDPLHLAPVGAVRACDDVRPMSGAVMGKRVRDHFQFADTGWDGFVDPAQARDIQLPSPTARWPKTRCGNEPCNRRASRPDRAGGAIPGWDGKIGPCATGGESAPRYWHAWVRLRSPRV